MRYPDPYRYSKNEFVEYGYITMKFFRNTEQALQASIWINGNKYDAAKMNDVNGGNYSKEAVKKSFKGWSISGAREAYIWEKGYPPDMDLYVCIKVKDRFECSLLLNCDNCGLSRLSRTGYHLLWYSEFLNSRLNSPREEPCSQPSQKRRRHGVRQGNWFICWCTKSGAILGVNIKWKRPFSFQNGQVYSELNFPPKDWMTGYMDKILN